MLHRLVTIAVSEPETRNRGSAMSSILRAVFPIQSLKGKYICQLKQTFQGNAHKSGVSPNQNGYSNLHRHLTQWHKDFLCRYRALGAGPSLEACQKLVKEHNTGCGGGQMSWEQGVQNVIKRNTEMDRDLERSKLLRTIHTVLCGNSFRSAEGIALDLFLENIERSAGLDRLSKRNLRSPRVCLACLCHGADLQGC